MISIIIPCKIAPDLSHYEALDYPEYELIVVDDETCPGLPATKRNWALDRAKGEYIAFIDADAYPPKDWLKNARTYLIFLDIMAVCGPGILPPNATWFECLVDEVLKILPFSYRVYPREKRYVSEFPTFNLIVRNNPVRFKPLLTGEDSLYCKELGGKILYAPEVFVYHHRRKTLRSFLKQTIIYGWHRGLLVGLSLLTLLTYGVGFICGFFTCPTHTLNRGSGKK